MSKRKNHKISSGRKSLSLPNFLSKNLSLLLIILGVIFMTFPSLFYINQTIQLSFFTPRAKVLAATPAASLPVQLRIESVSLSLPVIETSLINNRWEIAENGVSYLRTSAKPGTKGPIILYAHNTPDRFGPLKKVKKLEKIELSTINGEKHVYIVTKTLEVSPTKMDVFNQIDETLILYTCSGFADLKRWVIIATPSQEKIKTLLFE